MRKTKLKQRGKNRGLNFGDRKNSGYLRVWRVQQGADVSWNKEFRNRSPMLKSVAAKSRRIWVENKSFPAPQPSAAQQGEGVHREPLGGDRDDWQDQAG